MSDDCCSLPRPGGRPKATCPESGTRGRPVAEMTLRSLLRAGPASRLASAAEYCLCEAPDCDVVYFDTSGTSLFRRTDLTVRVGFKETSSPRPICYCFGHTVESIQAGIAETGSSSVVERITAEVRAGRCRCELANPTGRCCLGEVRRVVSAARRLAEESI